MLAYPKASPHRFTKSSKRQIQQQNKYVWLFAGHRCQARNDRAWAGGRATIGARQGQVYYEITVADEGLCRVGWSTRQASLDLGNEPISFGFGGTGAAPDSTAWQAAYVTAVMYAGLAHCLL